MAEAEEHNFIKCQVFTSEKFEAMQKVEEIISSQTMSGQSSFV